MNIYVAMPVTQEHVNTLKASARKAISNSPEC